MVIFHRHTRKDNVMEVLHKHKKRNDESSTVKKCFYLLDATNDAESISNFSLSDPRFVSRINSKSHVGTGSSGLRWTAFPCIAGASFKSSKYSSEPSQIGVERIARDLAAGSRFDPRFLNHFGSYLIPRSPMQRPRP